MKIKIINPVPDLAPDVVNEMKTYLQASLSADTEIDFVPVAAGFRSIETETQGIINGSQVLHTVMALQDDDCDGIFINCFDDPALLAAREVSEKPVMGPYLSSVHFASLLSEEIAIITTDDYGISCERRKCRNYGMENQIAVCEKVDLSVLDLHEGDLKARLLKCFQRLEQKQIYAAVLGCTGMNFIADEMRQLLKAEGCRVQLVEPLKTGMKMLELMIELGYRNSIKCTPIRTEDYIK